MTDTRILFVDDSGKPSLNDQTSIIVIGGFSIPAQHVPTLSRRIAGAKRRFFEKRGDPGKWELKSTRLIRTKSLRRSKNRHFLGELVRILADLDSTVYSASLDKRRMHHPMDIETTTGLQMQALLEHFSVECRAFNTVGAIVSDWSSHQLDAQASKSMATFVLSSSLPVHPTLYFADSSSSHAIQVADLIAGIKRRELEGDPTLMPIVTDLVGVRSTIPTDASVTHNGRPYRRHIRVF